MVEILLVGSGGFVGAAMRYLIGRAVHRLLIDTSFPYGILCVNLLGCLLIGFLGGLGESRGLFSSQARLLIFVGMLGGLTTFSSFAYDTFNLARGTGVSLALPNVALQMGLGLGAVCLGHGASRLI
jgi:fluoride exporter